MPWRHRLMKKYVETKPFCHRGLPVLVLSWWSCHHRTDTAQSSPSTSGLIVSQMLTLYTTPVIYLALDRMRARQKSRPAKPRANAGLDAFSYAACRYLKPRNLGS